MIIASMYPSPFDAHHERHDHNSTLIAGDKIYAYEEDKLTMIKNECTVRFPERSLMMGFKEFGIKPEMVDIWVFPKPEKTDLKSMEYFFTWIMKAYSNAGDNFNLWFSNHVRFVPHQLGHAALAVYGSSFDSCAFFCLDGGGDFGDHRNFIFGNFVDNKFKIIKKAKGLTNIGAFHTMLTDSLGFTSTENGKVSGLASYGKVIPELEDKFSDLIEVSENGITFNRYRYKVSNVNLDKIKGREYNRQKFINTYPSDTNLFRLSSRYLPQDIAATGEKVFIDSILNLLHILREKTSENKAVFSGGVFQNVSLNNAILESGLFNEVYFPMASGDSGLSLGAALYIKNQKKPTNRANFISPIIGPSYKDVYIEKILDEAHMIYNIEKDIPEKIANLISQGMTVGFFQGRAEYGPRSLGNRSLLADPRRIESKYRINNILKRRDWFMPYAPSILEEYLGDYVAIPYQSLYMQIAFNLKKNVHEKIPAALHVNDTSRIHVVNQQINPLYWQLINEFHKLSGIPVVLNTSFNRHGIPTISDPRQAIEHLLDGCMDYLSIHNYLVSFSDNRLTNNSRDFEESEDLLLFKHCSNRLEVIKDLVEDNDIINDYCKRLSELESN